MRSRLTALAVGPLLVLSIAPAGAGTPPQLTASTASSVRVESAWGASIGSNGTNGRVTVRAFDTARGSVVLSFRRLTPSTNYAVTIRRGACSALGKQVVAIGTFTATESGVLAATAPLTTAQVAAIRDAAVGTRRVSLVAGSGARVRCGTLAKSPAVSPQVWFGPLTEHTFPWKPNGGSIDFDALFAANAPWPRVAGRTQVFIFYADSVGAETSTAELRRMIDALKARQIRIALEWGPLAPQDGCGVDADGLDLDGFNGGAAGLLPLIRRVTSLGGTVSYLSLAEPFSQGVLFDGSGACHWSVATVARKVAAFVMAVRAEFPAIEIGLIEGYNGPAWVGYAKEWVAAYEAAVGERLPFLHLDVDYTVLGWPDGAAQVQAAVRSRGSRFGLFYTYWPPARTDAEWFAGATANVRAFEVEGAGPPDDAIFQVWTDKPDRALPETGATTTTRLVADYIRTRTTVTVAGIPATTGGAVAVTGDVRTLGGEPVAGGGVAVTATPRDGQYQVLEFTGTVPAGVSDALIGIRVNIEGAGPGSADLTFYEIGYAEGASTANLVPNARFDKESDRWGDRGDASFSVVPSDRGAGSMLRVVATPTQTLVANSGSFAVTPGAEYRFWVAVRVPEASIGNAYVTPNFLATDQIERWRDRYPLAPTPIPVGPTTTDATGAYSVTTSALEAGRYRLAATYAGDPMYWPARAEVEVVVP